MPVDGTPAVARIVHRALSDTPLGIYLHGSAVLGGFESIPGAIVGALIIGVIEMLFGGYISTAFQQVSAFCIIIVVLFVRPHGLFGHKPTHRV